jgi:hypothetical protein
MESKMKRILATIILAALSGICGATNLSATIHATINYITVSGDATVTNNDSLASGSLRYEVWAFATPYDGSQMAGYPLLKAVSGNNAPLPAGASRSESFPTTPYKQPPPGTYHFTAFLTEYTGAAATDDGYTSRLYLNDPTPLTLGSSTITPDVGLWWNPSESGTGYALDVKHGVLVVTTYSYTHASAPMWYISYGPITNNAFSAPLLKTLGGQCISCGYHNPVQNGDDGTVTINFTSATSATMTLPGRAPFHIEPQVF